MSCSSRTGLLRQLLINGAHGPINIDVRMIERIVTEEIRKGVAGGPA